MSFERYVARFERAVVVKKGEAQEYDLLMRDGQSVLKRSPRHVAPSVVMPLALSGVARPGETLTVIPGEYAGQPAPQVSRVLLRDGVADTSFSGTGITVTAADLGRTLTVIETARNASGQVQTTAEAVVAIVAPTVLQLSSMAETVVRDRDLPLLLAEIRADGDLPLSWALSDTLGGALIIGEADAMVRLEMVSMPLTGDHVIGISAANDAGSASAEFALSIAEPAVVAPRQVTLSRDTCDIETTADLPLVLAELSADGTAPLDWSVLGGGANVEIASDDTGSRLVLTTMPISGQHHLNVAAENGAGMAQASFTLTVTEAATAPSVVALSVEVAEIAGDAVLPVDLAVLSSDGTAPLEWSLVGEAEGFALQLGTEPVLQLVSMPPVGAHAITIRAANAAGSAEGAFALTVTAGAIVTVAPTAVALSAVSAELAADAALPVELATVSADGTQPLDWSLDGGDGAFTLDLGGATPVLRLVSRPQAGAHPVTVRAANAAGAAEAVFTLTVPASETGAVMTASQGTILSATTETDGSITFVLAEAGTEGATYSVPADKVAAGHATMLVPPTITEGPAGTFTVTDPGLYVAPANDPAAVFYKWMVAGAATGDTDETFTRQPAQAFSRGDLQVTVINRAMNEAKAAEVNTVAAWVAPVFTYTPMIFKAPERDLVSWAGPMAQDHGSALMFSRFRYRPDAGDADTRGQIMAVTPASGLSLLAIAREDNTQLRLMATVTTPAGYLFYRPLNTTIASGDLVDAIVSVGAGYSPINTAPSIHLAVWVNGVLAGNEAYTLPPGSILKTTAAAGLVLGGKTLSSPNDGGVSHDQHRSALWLGQSMRPVDARALFVTGEGGLAHPQLAVTILGTPVADVYNGTNHGSLGTPTTMSILS